MKKLIIIVIILVGCLSTTMAKAAWVHSINAKVTNMVEWEKNAPIYFKLSNGKFCWIPAAEKNFYSLILALYTTQKLAEFHCYSKLDSYGGVGGHRLHRILAN